jgi:hypothetical protein
MNNSHIDKVIYLATKDTKKGARVIAKVFYRRLLKQGYSENQIIDIATNILNCLIESLKGKERLTTNSEMEIIKMKGVDDIHSKAGRVRTFTKINNRYHDYGSVYYGNT